MFANTEFKWESATSGDGLVLTFPFTRSMIFKVEVSVGRVVDHSSLVLRIADIPKSAPRIQVTVHSSGERLQAPIVDWQSRLVITDVGDGVTARNLYLEARELLAKLSAEQRLFHELDMEAHPILLEIRRERCRISKDFFVRRVRAVSQVSEFLHKRLTARHGGSPIPPVTEDLHAALFEVSQVFRSAVSPLAPAGWHVVGEAFVRFGAGNLLEHVIVIPEQSESWRATEPESAAVVYFAELAMAALDAQMSKSVGIDSDMWLPLLPYLVKMQWCYWARVNTGKPEPFSSYGQGSRETTIAERAGIDSVFESVTDRSRLEIMITDKLRAHVIPF